MCPTSVVATLAAAESLRLRGAPGAVIAPAVHRLDCSDSVTFAEPGAHSAPTQLIVQILLQTLGVAALVMLQPLHHIPQGDRASTQRDPFGPLPVHRFETLVDRLLLLDDRCVDTRQKRAVIEQAKWIDTALRALPQLVAILVAKRFQLRLALLQLLHFTALRGQFHRRAIGTLDR